MSHTLTARFRIVTPMFLSGVKNKVPDDRIREPSLKGALRFWWRALNWGRFRQAEGGDAAALQALHKEEARLFGAAAEKGKSKGQSRFLLRVTEQPKTSGQVTDWPQNQTGSGYLGMGLFAMGQTEQQRALPEDRRFEVALRFRPGSVEDSEIQGVSDALKALGLLGGLGGRARRGFGSVALENLNGEDWGFKSADAYRRALAELFGSYPRPEAEPPFTAWSQGSRLAVLGRGRDARKAHANMGNAYKTFRTPAESGYRADAKTVFGRPLGGDDEKRRASPLIMHIHPAGDQFEGMGLFMPGQFYPDQDERQVDWSPIHDYLNRHEEVAV